ncbi:FMN-dependent NADH-azoreductase [Oceanisphaera arctica]|uniref:FMN dependent NADH:quinone oxidoreductase n=1 Tax=Oceanisphaera arctica TaxID=641510 RepID=A0A2P5TL48_9GAMM|nr:NAD(P)H-dependent oxidoreductase [Oceanisphaera arctica]PPL16011.1 FMN-dependent NADH-azoreductase [Oceanisphaera arctica]GHA15522.1 FMN-dependent NADH-azoreductase [Oceanisphaera arctica]
MKILQVNASARATDANSTRVANRIVERLLENNPDATVQVLDLATHPAPALDNEAITALFTPAEQRNAQQAARVEQSTALVQALQDADVLVLGVPMYNFGISGQLKNWIDNVVLNGVTFRYTEQGPQGLLQGKQAYIGFARGGIYRGTEADSQTPYLKTLLKFIGITDQHFIYAEGLNMGEQAAQTGFTQAEHDLGQALNA